MSSAKSRGCGAAALLSLLAAATLASLPQPARAHSVGACVDSVVTSCNAQFPANYEARIACANSGITQCEGHGHGGGGRPKPGADSFSSSGGGERAIKRLRFTR